MQLRAGVLYIVLFSVIAMGGYALVATADAPEATISEADAEYQVETGQEFQVADRTYNVTGISQAEAGGDGGGHGGGGGGETVLTGTVEYVNDSAVLEATWEDGDTVALEEEGNEYTVVVQAGDGNETADGNQTADESDSFTLREAYNESEYETVERDDGVYVVVDRAGRDELVPIDEFDEIDSRTYEVGDTLSFYDSESESVVEAEIVDVASDAVTVEWTGTEVEETEIKQGDVVSLNGQEYAAYFPSESQLYLSPNVDAFEQQQADVERFDERITGVWWVIVLSGLTAVLIAALAFLPVRG